MHWNALGRTPGWFWTQSSRRHEQELCKDDKMCSAVPKADVEAVWEMAWSTYVTHIVVSSTHPSFIFFHGPAVSTKASWLERASLLDGAGMTDIESRLISMHFVEQDCAMMNDWIYRYNQIQDKTGKLHQVMLLMFGISAYLSYKIV